MNAQITRHVLSSPQQQRGAALLILLTLVVLASSYTLLRRLNQTPSELDRTADTAAVLGDAKAALIGYALRSQTRPGELPCPDNNNNGDSALTCAGNATFRLPWKTLGLADLRDSSGERLWYAVDPLFSGAAGINSDTLAVQTIDTGSTRYAAVIIAPGKSLPGQSRTAGQQNNVTRYLEADNANNDNFFVTAAAGDFNDQVVGITRDELMQVVERRVLKEVSDSLNAYYTTNGYYPNPAAVNTPDCDSGIYAGTVPLNIVATCPSQAAWTAPSWFGLPNNWNQVIWYVVSSDCVEGASNCGSANLLTVNDPPIASTDIRALLIAGGAGLPGIVPTQVRPAATINDLLDSTENTNGDSTFAVLPVSASNNDQIQVVAP